MAVYAQTYYSMNPMTSSIKSHITHSFNILSAYREEDAHLVLSLGDVSSYKLTVTEVFCWSNFGTYGMIEMIKILSEDFHFRL